MSFLPHPDVVRIPSNFHHGTPGPSEVDLTHNRQDDWDVSYVLPHPDTFEHQTKTLQGTGPNWPAFGQLEDPAPFAGFAPGVEDPAMYNALPPVHKPVPPELLSRYSTLGANVVFLKRLERENRHRNPRPLKPTAMAPPLLPSADARKGNPDPPAPVALPPSTGNTYPPANSALPPFKGNPYPPPYTALPAFKSPPQSPSLSSSSSQPPFAFVNSNFTAGNTAGGWDAPQLTLPQAEPAPEQAVETKRNTKQACQFCRQRKIACHRAEPDTLDQRCDQCAMRKRPAVMCYYLTSTKTGRGKAKVKVMKGD